MENAETLICHSAGALELRSLLRTRVKENTESYPKSPHHNERRQSDGRAKEKLMISAMIRVITIVQR
jgi:hypothetical protein